MTISGKTALQELVEGLDKMPKADRGISWERENWQGAEQLNVYGQTAHFLKWVLDNTDRIRAIADYVATLEQERIVAQAECVESCDDPECPYTHTPLTLRQAYENSVYRMRSAESRATAAEAERDELKQSRDEWLKAAVEQQKRAQKAEACAERAERLLAEAVKALEPVAKEADEWKEFSDSELLVEPFPRVDSNLTVGDLRNARATLSKIEDTK